MRRDGVKTRVCKGSKSTELDKKTGYSNSEKINAGKNLDLKCS
jgi:hypothetical protein